MTMTQLSQIADKTISQSNRRALRNPWVLGWLAMVLIVLGMNAAMVVLAVVTNPGLVVDDYYERGRDFERNILSRHSARSALGWQMNLDVPERIALQQPGTFRIVVADAVSRPLTGARVQLFAYRPSDAKADFAVALPEQGIGRYQTEVEFPLKGIWDLIVHVEHADQTFDLPRRISVKAY